MEEIHRNCLSRWKMKNIDFEVAMQYVQGGLAARGRYKAQRTERIDGHDRTASSIVILPVFFFSILRHNFLFFTSHLVHSSFHHTGPHFLPNRSFPFHLSARSVVSLLPCEIVIISCCLVVLYILSTAGVLGLESSDQGNS